MNKKVKTTEVITYAGAFVALLIGSGFATGQEILQFFTAYGISGLFGVIICFVLFAFVAVEFVNYGHTGVFENPNDIYKEICGSKLGAFYDYFSILFLFLSFIVMVAGSEATFIEQYQAPKYLGGLILGVLAIITVILGLNRIVEVIGKIGPVIVIFAIIVGIVSISQNIGTKDLALGELAKLSAKGSIKKASSLGFAPAALTYVGFNIIWLAAFCASLGKDEKRYLAAKKGQIGGALAFSITVLIMAIAQILSIGDIYDKQIPTLALIRNINPTLAQVFSIVIILGIYTSAVPLLWTVIARFFKEKTRKFRIATIILGGLGTYIGLILQFDVLVNLVYAINGWLGFILILIMLIRFILRKTRRKRVRNAN